MFTGKEAANPSYPTQWALNPTAYQNVDSNSVDWAALAQQWIAMKEAAVIISAPPPPMKPDIEEGEAPMEVENPDTNAENSGPPPGAEWNASTNSWGGNWNQWGWNWSGASGVDPKMAGDPSITMMDGFNAPTDNTAPLPGFTSGPTPTFQHGYWTAPQDQAGSRGSSRSRERRSKSKNRDHNKNTRNRSQREKLPGIPAVIEPVVMPTPVPLPTIDAAKRRQLPAWIREGLEKMEREKQRAIEREEEKKAREEVEKQKKRLEEEELERLKAEAGGQPMLPAKSKFDTDSEGESDIDNKPAKEADPLSEESLEEDHRSLEEREEPPPLVKKSKEEIMQEVMLTVRRSLTEILLEVTDQEIHMVSQEELARYNAAQASRLNAMKASKSKALAAIASGLGLGAYESSSEDSGGEEEIRDVTDQQLQEVIRRKKSEFERTSREIEAEVRRAEQREAGDGPTPPATPDRPRRSRSSATPPPVESDTPVKLPERRPSNDKRNNHKAIDKFDGVRKQDIEEKPIRSSKRERTPSPPKVNNKTNQKENSPTTSDSEADSSSSSNESSAASEPEVKIGHQETKKRKRRSHSSSDSPRKSKKEKHKKETHRSDERNSYSKSKYDEYERSDRYRSKKKNSYYDKHKSSRSRDYERSHKDKYRDDSDDDRQRKRTKRSRSISYDSRSGRRRASRDRTEERSRRREKRSYDRGRSHERSGRDHDKYDRYERSRDDRRRSRSGSRARHRR